MTDLSVVENDDTNVVPIKKGDKVDVAISLATEYLSITEIAEKHNLSRQTIYNWQSEESFKALVEEIKDHRFAEVAHMVRESTRTISTQVFNVLKNTLQRGSEGARVKVALALLPLILEKYDTYE